MYLVVLARVFEANGGVSKVDVDQGIVREVDARAVEAWDGEHVLVHAGHSIPAIDMEAAEKPLRFWNEIKFEQSTPQRWDR
jgi:hydrogenase maturation factor